MPFAGAVAARKALKRYNQASKQKNKEVGPSRARLAFEGAVEITRGKLLVKKYDEDGSGKLEVDDLKRLLTDLNYGRPVSDDEVRFILSATDIDKDGAIYSGEIQFLVMIWNTYARSLPEIDSLMETYDVNQDGRLDRTEVRAMLTHLNDGKKVREDEVDFVLEEAGLLSDGVIAKPEVKRAIRAWYSAVEVKQQSKFCTLL